MATLLRNSIGVWLLAIAMIAIALAPLANLTDGGLTVMMYSKFGLLIVATFLARYGPESNAARWFGFTAFGRASVLFGVPGLWAGVNEFMVAPGVNLADLSGSIGSGLEAAMGRPVIPRKLDAVVGTWLNLSAAIAGGSLVHTLERRRGRRTS